MLHSEQPSRVLFFEPLVGGHQAFHIQHLVAYLLAVRPNFEVVFVLGEDLVAQLPGETKEVLENLAVPWCTLWILPDSDLGRLRAANLTFRGLSQWFYLKRLVRSLSIAHAHFHFFDHALLGAALPFQAHGRCTYSGLIFRPSMHYATINKCTKRSNVSWHNWLKTRLYRRMLLNPAVKVVFSFDRYFKEYAVHNFAEARKIVFIPDPVPVPIEQLIGGAPRMSRGRITFLLFGALSERKGVLVTLQALALLSESAAAQCHIKFAGKIDPTIREEFYGHLDQLKSSGTAAWIEVCDRYLTDQEITSMVSEADVILAPYIRHVGSSGVLYWAAAARKPVITQDYGLVGKEAREFGLGLTADTRSAASVAEALVAAINAEGRNLVRTENQARYIAGHTSEHFADALVKAIMPQAEYDSLSDLPAGGPNLKKERRYTV